MPPVISTPLLNRLCENRDYSGLVWISSVLSGSRHFMPNQPSYGLPDILFNFVERITWFSQSFRSGVWVYFEATPFERQSAMLSTLKHDAHHMEFSSQYDFGIENWRDLNSMKELDVWINANDDTNNDICWQIVSSQRDLIQCLSDH